VKKVFKWIGLSVLGLLVVVLGSVYALSGLAFNKEYKIKVEKITIPSDSASILRGKHLVEAVAKCVDCHKSDMGGGIVIDAMPMVGRVAATNLTRGKGGIGTTYTDDDWVRAIRHGVRPDGSPLMVMPSQEFWHQDDDELGAIIAYIKSLPPVDRTVPERSVGPMSRLLYLADQIPLIPAELIDHDGPRPAVAPPGPTAEYGKHMVATGGCYGCHGPALAGGPIPGMPPGTPEAANITPDKATGIGNWTEADFTRVLRTGKRPDGSEVNPMMPWKATALLSDDEIRAIWLFVKTFPAKPKGFRE
jgi:mono/diheme cytochrome c family protein